MANSHLIKICKECRQEVPLSKFPYGRPPKRGPVCTRCRHLKYGPAAQAKRRTAEGRSKIRKNRAQKERTETIKEKARAAAKAWRELHPLRPTVYGVFQKAVSKGLIARPKACESCGKEPGLSRNGRSLLHGHHDDYSRPLDVRWLCNPCHVLVHHPLKEQS